MKHLIQKTLTLFLAAFILLATPALTPAAGAADASSAAGIVSTSSGSLNVRSGAGASFPVVKQLPRSSHVTLLSRSGNWWRVEVAHGTYGFVSADFITPVLSHAAAVRVSSGYLNVRSGPGTNHSILSVLPGGRVVLVLSASGGWSRILYNGTSIGFVSSSFLSVPGLPSPSLLWPVPSSFTVNQPFRSGVHLGIDIAPTTRGVSGDRVVASLGGTVVYSGWLSGYGYVTYINSYQNGQYLQLRYAHLASSPYVSPGQIVSAGQTIGLMGNTGTSTGVHLHFEVRIRSSAAECLANTQSTPADPMYYLP